MEALDWVWLGATLLSVVCGFGLGFQMARINKGKSIIHAGVFSFKETPYRDYVIEEWPGEILVYKNNVVQDNTCKSVIEAKYLIDYLIDGQHGVKA